MERTEIVTIDDAAFVKALAHPLRLRILAMLEEWPASPSRLAGALDRSVSLVSYHVRRLQDLGLAELVETRRGHGGLEHIYAVRRRPTFSDAAWQQLDAQTRSRLLIAMLRQTNEFVTRSALAGGFDRPDAHLSRTSMTLDREGWDELVAAAAEWLRTVAGIEQRAGARGSTSIDVGLVVQLFEASPFSGGRAPPGAPPPSG